jgi:hypothetical protein
MFLFDIRQELEDIPTELEGINDILNTPDGKVLVPR